MGQTGCEGPKGWTGHESKGGGESSDVGARGREGLGVGGRVTLTADAGAISCTSKFFI